MKVLEDKLSKEKEVKDTFNIKNNKKSIDGLVDKFDIDNEFSDDKDSTLDGYNLSKDKTESLLEFRKLFHDKLNNILYENELNNCNKKYAIIELKNSEGIDNNIDSFGDSLTYICSDNNKTNIPCNHNNSVFDSFEYANKVKDNYINKFPKCLCTIMPIYSNNDDSWSIFEEEVLPYNLWKDNDISLKEYGGFTKEQRDNIKANDQKKDYDKQTDDILNTIKNGVHKSEDENKKRPVRNIDIPRVEKDTSFDDSKDVADLKMDYTLLKYGINPYIYEKHLGFIYYLKDGTPTVIFIDKVDTERPEGSGSEPYVYVSPTAAISTEHVNSMGQTIYIFEKLDVFAMPIEEYKKVISTDINEKRWEGFKKSKEGKKSLDQIKKELDSRLVQLKEKYDLWLERNLEILDSYDDFDNFEKIKIYQIWKNNGERIENAIRKFQRTNKKYRDRKGLN